MRWCAHNGEINTLRGNKNWMRAREGVMRSSQYAAPGLLESIYPIVEEGGSDSAAFDNVLELLIMNKVVSLPEAVMMMIPEAWQNQPHMEPEKRAFYEVYMKGEGEMRESLLFHQNKISSRHPPFHFTFKVGRLFDGAMGWTCSLHLFRWPLCRRIARQKRIASMPLLSHL